MDNPLVGIDIGGTKMLMLAQWQNHQQIEQVPTGLDATHFELERHIERFVSGLAASPKAIGIAIPGLVGDEGEVIACDVLPLIAGWRPAAALDKHDTTAVLNDAEAALVAETADLPKAATAAIVMAGTGIGAALMASGTIIRGSNGWAGELGSMPVRRVNGTISTLDEQSSGAAIQRDLGLSIEDVLGRAERGDEGVLARITEAGHGLGCSIATLINLLNPHRVIIGGGALSLPGYGASALEAIARYSLAPLREVCEVRSPSHGKLVVAVGAALRAASLLTIAAKTA